MYNKLFIETDLGRDPDDMIAILWLLAQSNINIDTIFITPGDVDQIAVAEFIRKECSHNFRINTPKINREKRIGKSSSGGAHYKLLKKYGAPLTGTADADIQNIPYAVSILSIGPMTNLYTHLSSINEQNNCHFLNTVIQGGFTPYRYGKPSVILDKFTGLEYCPSFNFSGDIKAFDWAADFFHYATYVSKNICHTLKSVQTDFNDKPNTRAGELMYEFISIYFEKHKEKALHDVLPAMIVNEEFGDFVDGYPDVFFTSGKPVRRGNTYSWESWKEHPKYAYNKSILDVNYEKFYRLLRSV